MRTQVAIIGGGPAGMFLAHLLYAAGVAAVVLEQRSRAYVEGRVRAGVLEDGTVQLMERLGLAARLGFALSASAVGELPHYPMKMTPTKIVIEVPTRRGKITADPVMKRLGGLADAFGRNGEVHIG